MIVLVDLDRNEIQIPKNGKHEIARETCVRLADMMAEQNIDRKTAKIVAVEFAPSPNLCNCGGCLTGQFQTAVRRASDDGHPLVIRKAGDTGTVAVGSTTHPESAMADKIDMSKVNVDVVRGGSAIVVPPEVTLPVAIEVLRRQMESEEKFVVVNTPMESYPLDLALALTRAVEKRYNFVATQGATGMFGFEIPPPLVGVEVDVNKVKQVYWGQIPLPGFDEGEFVQATVAVRDNLYIGQISAKVKGKHRAQVDELIDLTRKMLHDHSIYKGRAVRIVFQDPTQERFNPNALPRFIDLTRVREEELVFSDTVEAQVKTNIFNLVEHTDLCAQYGIPRKRGVLLEGPFGTGKTLTAHVLAKKCEANGWTFLYLQTVKHLPQAIQFAKMFGRCVIFAEDIDQAFEGDTRSEEINALLNTIDGIDTKSSEVMVVLTTNSVTDIHQAMLRPGRLDAVISIAAPDATAIRKLFTLYARDLLVPNTDLTAASELMKGRNAASVREVIERAKLSAVGNLRGGDTLRLTGNDLVVSARTMLNHLALLAPKTVDNRDGLTKVADAIATLAQTTPNNAAMGAASAAASAAAAVTEGFTQPEA